MNPLATLPTPTAVVDLPRLQRNIARMQAQLDALGVKFRPHVKTTKCADIVRLQVAAGASGLTVSTLKEARQFFAEGHTDILYAVGIVPNKFEAALALRREGCDLKLITDNMAMAQALGTFGRANGHRFELWIEVDTDGHRSGVAPGSDLLIELGLAIEAAGSTLGGVMTHAGASYELDTPEALAAMAEQERAGCVRAAERLRAAGLACPVVSVGSTPTALSARALPGVTEVRAGVYAFFDLVMANVGVCAPEDIALSVLTTVIGHQPEKGWAIVDAGWMAMSRDRGTQRQRHDYGYGQVCDAEGHVLPGYVLTGANQEHGILAREGEADPGIVQRFPVGTTLRILPNHACATAAQFPQYEVVTAEGALREWPRFQGW
ncbi:DSD1 family PLP-dependent enzyme [Ramlibacter sp.]|uniref:DSD1 family PLP-dependent enzyme n=1 Tax=Ramlibacter sp. TaxID=1917967 RepID=UPI0035AE9864